VPYFLERPATHPLLVHGSQILAPSLCAPPEIALIEAAANKTARIFLTYHEIVALRAEGPGKAGATR
jgi:hypothetical protein